MLGVVPGQQIFAYLKRSPAFAVNFWQLQPIASQHSDVVYLLCLKGCERRGVLDICCCLVGCTRLLSWWYLVFGYFGSHLEVAFSSKISRAAEAMKVAEKEVQVLSKSTHNGAFLPSTFHFSLPELKAYWLFGAHFILLILQLPWKFEFQRPAWPAKQIARWWQIPGTLVMQLRGLLGPCKSVTRRLWFITKGGDSGRNQDCLSSDAPAVSAICRWPAAPVRKRQLQGPTY